ncbi:MAG: aldose 1-epimerase [Pseudonocardiales bacterium]|nr:aldose 1-epimerase [Pseudonocardiales bacterium]
MMNSPAAFNGAVLAPWPNRIRDGRWSWRGQHRQLPITEPATGSALHGLVNDVLWQPDSVAADAVTLSVPIAPTAGYPFALPVSVRWSLSADGLRQLGAVNTGAEPAQFGAATHPFFRLPDARVDDLDLQLRAGQWLETDSNLLPVALRPTSGTELDFTEPRSLSDLRPGRVQHRHGSDRARARDAMVRGLGRSPAARLRIPGYPD